MRKNRFTYQATRHGDDPSNGRVAAAELFKSDTVRDPIAPEAAVGLWDSDSKKADLPDPGQHRGVNFFVTIPLSSVRDYLRLEECASERLELELVVRKRHIHQDSPAFVRFRHAIVKALLVPQ
jgi:hypothetical protein